MTPIQVNLLARFMNRSPGIISITGGGGKTTLLFCLARAFVHAGERVICTTTTRMRMPENSDWLEVQLTDTPEASRPDAKALYLARPHKPGETPEGQHESRRKIRGYEPDTIDRLSARLVNIWIVNEADGAAERPLKAPAVHEPVIPSSSTVCVAVIGLSCMNRIFSEKTAFRTDEISRITGLRKGDTTTPESLVPLVTHPEGLFKGVPAGASRILLCNQADLPGAEEAGKEFAMRTAKAAPGFLDGLYISSLRMKGLECLSCPTE